MKKYEDRYQKMCFDDEANIAFSSKTCRLIQQADKEIKEFKLALTALCTQSNWPMMVSDNDEELIRALLIKYGI